MNEPVNDFTHSDDAFRRMTGELSITAGKMHAVMQEAEQIMGPMEAGLHGLDLTTIIRLNAVLKYFHELGKAMQVYYNREGVTLRRIANEIMTDDDIEAMAVDGYNYKPVQDDKFTINKDSKEGFIDWCKDDEEFSEYVKEDVHPSTLKSACKKRLEDGRPLPPQVNHYPQASISSRKLPKK